MKLPTPTPITHTFKFAETIAPPQKGPLNLTIVGCGNRGSNYAHFAMEYPQKCAIVCICEPRTPVRDRMKQKFAKTLKRDFADWRDMLKEMPEIDKEANIMNPKHAVVIALQDKYHKECAVEFAKRGYHILLEKPMAVTEEDCIAIHRHVKEAGVQLCVGHVLRYTPITQKVKQLISDGAIGKLAHIQHLEPVGWFHHAHSYVRGAWSREEESSFLLMTKSCHDIDWLTYVTGKKCVQVSSFGGLTHFNKQNQPKGAGERCLDCPSHIENNCPYSAKKIYLEPVEKLGHQGWPVNVIVENGELPDIENVTDALRTGPYGRCVYSHDNNVCDTQTVQLQYEGGVFVSFSLTAFSWDVCTRKTRIFGSKGEIEVYDDRIEYKNFLSMEHHIFKPEPIETELTNHAYADFYLMQSFVDSLNENDPLLLSSNADETLYTHRLVFAAERARLENEIVKL